MCRRPAFGPAAQLVRRKLTFIIVLLLVLLALDLQRSPADQISTRAAIGSIDLYQATLSKWYAAMGLQCRFTPTCSHYGEAAIRKYGAARGGWMAMKRVLRCGPWTPTGTHDPVV